LRKIKSKPTHWWCRLGETEERLLVLQVTVRFLKGGSDVGGKEGDFGGWLVDVGLGLIPQTNVAPACGSGNGYSFVTNLTENSTSNLIFCNNRRHPHVLPPFTMFGHLALGNVR
jgi:hypothetical protein